MGLATVFSPSVALGLKRVSTALLLLGVGLGLALLPLRLAAAAVLGGALLLLALARPHTSLYFLVFAVPFGTLWEIKVGTVAITATEFVVLAMLSGWLARLAWQRDLRIRLPGLLFPYALFLGLLLLSASTAFSASLSLKELFKWLEFAAVLLVAANLLETPEQRKRLVLLLLVAAALEGLLGWFQFFTASGPPSFRLDGPFLRAYGSFGQPNPFAGYLNLVLPLGLALLLGALGRLGDLSRPRAMGMLLSGAGLLTLGSSAVMVVGVFMSFSRGAWLALLAGAAAMLAVYSRSSRGFLLGVAAALALLGLLGSFELLPPQVTDRLALATRYFGVFDARQVRLTPENWPIVERMATWQAAWAMFQDRPFTGVGLGNFSVFYPTYALPGWEKGSGHAHNFYLNVLSETGIPGLTLYAGFQLTLLVYVLLRLRRLAAPAPGPRDELVTPYAIGVGVLGLLVALTVHNLFDNLFVHSMTAQLGLPLGLLAALESPDQLRQSYLPSGEERARS